MFSKTPRARAFRFGGRCQLRFGGLRVPRPGSVLLFPGRFGRAGLANSIGLFVGVRFVFSIWFNQAIRFTSDIEQCLDAFTPDLKQTFYSKQRIFGTRKFDGPFMVWDGGRSIGQYRMQEWFTYGNVDAEILQTLIHAARYKQCLITLDVQYDQSWEDVNLKF